MGGLTRKLLLVIVAIAAFIATMVVINVAFSLYFGRR